MLYFKNVELADTYHVSLRTVLNWIEAAKQGKLDIALHEKNGKTYVANTSRNIASLEKIVTERKKYRNTRGLKSVSPKPEFYELYNDQQILDIISNLDVHHEIPRQYNYFDDGARFWDQYATRLFEEETPNMLNCTLKLLDVNRSYIDSLIAEYKQINVIDLGVGNALPAKGLLKYLMDRNILNRYIALDISPEMLQIARSNIKKWFGDSISYEGYELDVNYDRFNNLLANEYSKNANKETLNIVLVLGGTLCNLRTPDSAFKVVHDSLGRKDILIYTQKLDTEASRRYFDFNIEPGKAKLAQNHRLIFDLLNIDPEFYDVEIGFDEKRSQRYIRVRLKIALTINFTFSGGEHSIELNKEDTILVWRAWQQSALDVVRQFDKNDFDLLQVTQTEDREYILTVSQIKTEQQ